MYQPYGTSSDVGIIQQPSTEPLREKFIGKEFDEEGAVYSEFQFDIDISGFVNRTGTIKNMYVVFEEPSTTIKFQKTYNLVFENGVLCGFQKPIRVHMGHIGTFSIPMEHTHLFILKRRI